MYVGVCMASYTWWMNRAPMVHAMRWEDKQWSWVICNWCVQKSERKSKFETVVLLTVIYNCNFNAIEYPLVVICQYICMFVFQSAFIAIYTRTCVSCSVVVSKRATGLQHTGKVSSSVGRECVNSGFIYLEKKLKKK